MGTYRARVEIQHRKPAEKDAKTNNNPVVVIKAGEKVNPSDLGASEKDVKELLKRGTIEELDDDGRVVNYGFGPAAVPPRDQDPEHNRPVGESPPSVTQESHVPGQPRPTVQQGSPAPASAPAAAQQSAKK